MPSDRDDRVLVQVVELSHGREIRKLSNVAELLRSRTEDIQQAIVTGSQTVAGRSPWSGSTRTSGSTRPSSTWPARSTTGCR